ncbi:VC0807 family protein [Streptomyces sp. NPDC048483]|uniref:VC0807 family protein n=1 Tax=Streptomyces sp. NPDC048483 TaxID=3154927 RepID=UPI00343DAE59
MSQGQQPGSGNHRAAYGAYGAQGQQAEYGAAPQEKGQFTAEEKRQIAASRRKLLTSLFISLVLPLGLYYGLRDAGVSPLWALLLGCVPPLLQSLYAIAKQGKPDAVALFTLSLLIIGGLTSLITGSPRWILAKSGVLTMVIGVALLITTHKRPAIFQGVISLQPSADATARWEALWRDYAEIRHIMRVTNVIWGVGFILDGIVRFILAYRLDVDAVPTATTVMFVVSIALFQIVSKRYGRLYMRRRGLRLRGTTVERI